MTSIIMRSALVAHGQQPPPELHSIVIDHRGRHVVTWAEVLEARRKRQRLILERKYHVDRWRPWKVWVAYYDMDLFGGWQAFVENREHLHWIDRDLRHFKDHLYRLFPLVLGFGGEDRWEQWKVEFARRYKRGTHHRKPRGSAVVWWDQMHSPELQLPTGAIL